MALEDRRNRQAPAALLNLQVLLLPWAPVALVVPVVLFVHSYQEVLYPLVHLFLQEDQIGLQALLNP